MPTIPKNSNQESTTLLISQAHLKLFIQLLQLVIKYDNAFTDFLLASNSTQNMNAENLESFRASFIELYQPTPIITNTINSFFEQLLLDFSGTVGLFKNPASSHNLEEILLSFDKAIDTDNRKQSGSFYTPIELVDLIITAGLKLKDKPLSTLQCLDPACGSGIFLVRLIRLYFKNSKLDNWDEFCSWLKSNLTAYDLNPLTLTFTWLAIKIVMWELSFSNTANNPTQDLLIRTTTPKLIAKNFLLDEHTILEATINSFTLSNPDELNETDYDLILGNPPYGLSRNEQISEQENKLYKKIYQSELSGKPNKYMLFMAKCWRKVKNHGVIALVVPNSWLGIKSSDNLRKLLLQEGSLQTIYTFEEELFKDASVEAIIFVVQKSAENKNVTIKRYNNLQEQQPSEETSIDTFFLKEHLNSRIPITWDSSTIHTVTKIFKNSYQIRELSKYFKPSIAMQAYALGRGVPPQTQEIVSEHTFHFDHKKDETCIPYLAGKDVLHNKISWSGQYLSYGPWLAEPQNLDRFSSSRILVREILGKYPKSFIATYTDSVYLYNKSILHIHSPNTNSIMLLKALTLILNSEIASYILLHTGIKSQRKLFPKIVLDDLLNFPIPKVLIENQNLLCEFAELYSSAIDSDSYYDINTIIKSYYNLD